MTRLLAIFAGLLGVLLVPLALSAPTALLLVPAHLGLAVVACLGAGLDGIDGEAERARRWGFGFLLATGAMVAALQVGAEVHGSALGYWGIPWSAALCWSWIPPVVSGLAGSCAAARRGRRVRKVVRARAARQ